MEIAVTEDASSDTAYGSDGQEPASQRNARSQPIRDRLSAIRDSLSVRNPIVAIGVLDERGGPENLDGEISGFSA